ncbi:MAG: hypothetical protein Q4C38_01965 [bacterium]|nr:hypothetical protein [bacterium]
MLPKVFINKIDKSIKNNKESYYYKGDEPIIIDDADINVKETINEIFNSDSFVYKVKVDIKFKNGKSKVYEIVAMKNNELISIDGDKIKVDDIVNIKKAN